MSSELEGELTPYPRALLVTVYQQQRFVLQALVKRRFGCSTADAEDAVSDAFAKLWCIDQGEVHRVEVKLYDLVRRFARRQLRYYTRHPAGFDSDVSADDETSPEAFAIATELDEQIVRAIEMLPRSQRACCDAVLLKGLSVFEAAHTLGMPAKSVANRVAEGRAAIRRRLARQRG